MLVKSDNISLAGLLVANLSSFALDYVAQFKVGGTNLNFFIVNQLPVSPPSTYQQLAPWSPDESLSDWLFPRILELTYTAWDLQPFAEECGYHNHPFRWDEERRFLIRCELDAAYFHLYGIEREDVDYIMETFPIVKRKDEASYDSYRTKEKILEIYDKMKQTMETGKPYQTLLDPPPGQPVVWPLPPDRLCTKSRQITRTLVWRKGKLKKRRRVFLD